MTSLDGRRRHPLFVVDAVHVSGLLLFIFQVATVWPLASYY